MIVTVWASVTGTLLCILYWCDKGDKECVCSHVYSDQSTDCMGFKLNHNWTIPKVNGKNNSIFRESNPIWPWLPPSGTHGVLVSDGSHCCLPSNSVKLSIWPWTWDSPTATLCPFVKGWKQSSDDKEWPSLSLINVASLHSQISLEAGNQMRHHTRKYQWYSLFPINCFSKSNNKQDP